MRALALVAVFACAATAHAQSYSFSVPTVSMNVDVRRDGVIGVDYEIVFENGQYASPIDVVDVGMPDHGYDLSTMTASVDGHEITDIAKSTYIETGVQASLGEYAIPPGATGTFAFHYEFPNLVFSDTTNDALASFRITPTWFDPNVVQGTTHLAVLVHLPPGIRPEEAIWQGLPFSGKSSDPSDGRTVVAWDWGATSFTAAHPVAVSFPRRGMTGIVRVTKLDLLLRWWSSGDSAMLRAIIGALLLLAFSIVYFRFTGGTGFVPWLIVDALCVWVWWQLPTSELVSIPVVPVLLVLMERRMRRGKTHYLPPIASVEGGGIKRGLTAPEAAVLLEVPLSRVLTMVIFGMLKKGLLVQVEASPLRVVVPAALRDPSPDAQRAAAAAAGVVIQGYEHAFLNAIITGTPAAIADGGQQLDVIGFTEAVHDLVQATADRVLAFDVDETKKYYRQIVERAWMEAKSVGEIAQRDQVIDKNLEWLLVGDDFDRRFSGFGTSYVYYPMWMRPSPAPITASLGGGGGSGVRLPTAKPAPSFGDVSASFAGWFSGVSGQIAGTITPATRGGAIDLSGFDRATGAVLKAMATSSGRGGGGGGGGGCACAGCACACACAGGGR